MSNQAKPRMRSFGPWSLVVVSLLIGGTASAMPIMKPAYPVSNRTATVAEPVQPAALQPDNLLPARAPAMIPIGTGKQLFDGRFECRMTDMPLGLSALPASSKG